ncbi:MAG: glycosyltransferase family 39 protein, partial [Anaerolineae bacterium]|nr:glycosyltransferase family 39 protein [Anaerolineae bacterium]
MKSTKFALPLLALALILIVGMGIRVRGIISTNQERAINRPLEDDSYFYFSLGRHIANGDGAMIDDRHLTTGFQPLWGGIVAGVFLIIEENNLAISMVQLVGALIGAVGCILVYDLTRRITHIEWGALALSALWFWSPQSVRVQLNGMETGIATVMIIALFYVTYRAYRARKWRWHIFTAMMFGIAFMTRIDIGLLIAPSALVLILVAPPKKSAGGQQSADTHRYESPFTRDFEAQLNSSEVVHFSTPSSLEKGISKIGVFIFRRVRVGVVMVFVACLFLIPWVLFTQSINKPILPESGDAVRAASLYVYPDPPPQPVFTVMTENTPRFLDYYGGWTADFTRSLASQVWAIAPLSDQPTYPADPVDQSRLSEYAYLFIGTVVVMFLMTLMNGDNGFRWLAIIYIVWWMSLTAAYVLVIYGIWYFARYSYPLAEMISVLIFIAFLRPAHPDNKGVIRG